MSETPFETDIAAMLASARVLDAPEAAKDRLRTRLALSLPPMDPTPGNGSHGAPAHRAPQPSSLLPSSVPTWTLGAALVFGAVLGLSVTRLFPPEVRTVVVAQAPASVAALASTKEPAMQASGAGLTPDDLPRVPSAAVTFAPIANMGQDLSKERAILDIAKVALGRGDASSALARIEEHARAFPRGALSEEREALAIQALASSGRVSEAKVRAVRFAKSFPRSVLLPAIQASVGETP
jgi:hypothetical protein